MTSPPAACAVFVENNGARHMRAATKTAVTPPRPFSYTLSYDIQHDSWCFLSSGVVDYDRRGKEGNLYAVLTPQTEPHRYHP